jgi:hypothetical protein
MFQPDVHDCIQACQNCFKACERCAIECLREAGMEMTRCIELNLVCAGVCAYTERELARKSDRAERMALICAEICDVCFEECNKHLPLNQCAVCAEKCAECAERCLQMAGAMNYQPAEAAMYDPAVAKVIQSARRHSCA